MQSHRITDADVEAWAGSLSRTELRRIAFDLMVRQRPAVVTQIIEEAQGREEAAFAARELFHRLGRRIGSERIMDALPSR
jgi:hypothetical protein